MHESFRNVSPSWIAFGWFIAVSLTALILLALAAFGIIGVETLGDSIWVTVALGVSFLVTGFFVGTRVAAAPILHGLSMALFSLVAWFAINLFLGEPTGETTWRSLSAQSLLALVALQAVAAIVGARLGVRFLRTPATPPS
ncbi:MAG: hypothetical protein GEU90_10235 [Gemmatimonas sp.]|nr:hypothetical protein [Gemmatimonas sp.]